MSENREPSPNLFLFSLLQGLPGKHSFSDTAIDVFTQSGRGLHTEGEDHIPKIGRFILTANHFNRVDNPITMEGPQKMNDMFETMGGLVDVVRRHTGYETEVVWTPSQLPRPEALLPKNKTPREVLRWLAKGAKYAPVNWGRDAFIHLYRHAPDMVPVPHSQKEMKRFYQTITDKLDAGAVIGLFPEGETTQELRRAKSGFAHIAIKLNVPTLPVAVYDIEGILQFRFGEPIDAPPNLHDKKRFVNDIMTSIAQMLPPQLRGYYNDQVHE